MIGLTTSTTDGQDLPVLPQSQAHASPDYQQAHRQRRSRSKSFSQASTHVSATSNNTGSRSVKAESAQTRSKLLSYQPPNTTPYRRTKVEAHLSPSRELDHQNRDLQRQLRKATEDTHVWKQKAAEHESERDSARAHANALQKELNTVRNQGEALLKDYNQMKALLEARRQELQDAQRFMRTADTIAESEIVQQVRDLNTEIFNLAQSMSGAERRTGGHERAKRRAAERLVGILGKPLLDLLESVNLHGDTVLLEIAMQAAASERMSWVISTWTNDPGNDSVFASVHRRIQRSESQSVAGQWRALTRKSVEDEYLVNALTEDRLKDGLLALFVHVAALSDAPFLKTEHAEAVQLMVAKALKIRHIIGEAMVSSDYEMVVPRAGTAFAAAEMGDAYKPRGARPRAADSSVLCCTSLGLRRVEKIQGELRVATLVKSDVGLDTLLEDLGVSVDVDDDGMSISS